MNLSALTHQIRSLPAYRAFLEGLHQGRPSHPALGLPRSVRPILAGSLLEDIQGLVVFLVTRADRMIAVAEEIPVWAPDIQVLPFPNPGPLFYEQVPWESRTLHQRLRVLSYLADSTSQASAPPKAEQDLPIILAPARAVMTRTLSPLDFQTHSRLLQVGQSLRVDQLLQFLVISGYGHSTLVLEPGQFSRRGGIVDIWPPAQPNPVRVEFFGDEIESLRFFNPSDQRSIERCIQVSITPAREGLPYLNRGAWEHLLAPEDRERQNPDIPLEFMLPWMNPQPHSLLDYLPSQTLVLLDDQYAFEDAINELEEQAVAFAKDQKQAGFLPTASPLPYLTLPEINERLSDFQTVNLGMMGIQDDEPSPFEGHFSPGPRFGGQLRPFMNHLSEQRALHELTVVASRQAPRLAELWSENDDAYTAIDELPIDLMPGDLYFVHGPLTDGWTLEPPTGQRVHLLTDAEIFGWGRPRPRRRLRTKASAPEASYADLQPGDHVVHIDFGIGRFTGLVERELEGLKREFLLIAYADNGQLFVPIHQADRITKYIGADSSIPNISRLGTQEWERTKQRARQDVEEVARELLELYAKRMTITGHAFSPDTPWQKELEASFPYIETEDQIVAIQAVKEDMERNRPMDRLICGDVGYGKTEISLRAAFKAAVDGKQVAILVPTTILAQQHYQTFQQRLAAFPVEVEMLSRFRTRRETTDILHRLAAGQIDIIIGTHRLLQQDVHFKDLGLIVVDEEQRFGVTHKEYLKQKRTEVDVLTLTATPIPRTLYMALTGSRDISTIDSPPEARLPITTHVGPYDPRLVRQAVLRELDRGGQVFFVHNRVHTINGAKKRLDGLMPEAKIAIAHGQMPERQLSQVMERFSRGEVDVLVCSSIIESGLDYPNANTLIIDRADRFGLAQLYQLRGRVGRGATRAYAYLFRPHHLRVSEEAIQRLETIAEHSQLGAGYSIAMRDLEMRGAGEILGTRQHGHIAAIGFHLYTRLVSSAIRHLKTSYPEIDKPSRPLPASPEHLPVSIDLPLSSIIPPAYIADRPLRLQLYRRMAECRTWEDIQTMFMEMEDRFGPPPIEVENLLYQFHLKILAVRGNIATISTRNGQVLLQFAPGIPREAVPYLGEDVRESKSGLWLKLNSKSAWKERLIEILTSLANAQDRKS